MDRRRFTITKHAEKRLRSRTGWPRKAVKRAVRELPEHGVPIRQSEDGVKVYLFRDLEWLVADDRIVTVIPPRGGAQNSMQNMESRNWGAS